MPFVFGILLLIEGVALSAMISIRGLVRAAREVESALLRGDLDAARELLNEE